MGRLNPQLKLNPRLFDLNVEQESLRQGFGEGLLAAGEENEKVVALCADLKDSTRVSLFAEKFPHRFFELGVAEQNMASVASGLAAMGKIPFIASYATFSPGRNWEQIRTTICVNKANVKIAGHHTGLSVGPDGATHQALEDIALMRVLPEMVVITPCDATEAARATYTLAKLKGPAYIRLTREKTPKITTTKTPFAIGKIDTYWESAKPELAFIACGPLLYQTLQAARALEREGIESVVLNAATIKPLDRRAIVEAAKAAGAVITVEEHQRAGGLGSVVAEVLAEEYPVPVGRVGVDDRFGQSGEPLELIEHYGLGKDDILLAARRVLQKKHFLRRER